MSNAPVNNGRRRFLTAATSVVGGVGVVGVAVPYIASWNPSAKAKAAGADACALYPTVGSKGENDLTLASGPTGHACDPRRWDAHQLE